jgi:plastocyanin
MVKFISSLLFAGLWTFTFAGDLTGTVNYDGKIPKKKTLRMDSDPVCNAAHSEAVYKQSFVVDENGNLANVLIYLKNASADTVPSESAVIDQKGCMYAPHVIGVQAGQEVKILNSDPTMHNIHGLPKVNKEFNFGMPKTIKERSVTFDKPEDVFVIKCDVHPWMKSYVHVFDHPYFAVSGTDGKYAISGVPEGEYEVVAWQEKFGSKRTLTQTVTIGDDSTMLDFIFVRPSKK